MSTREDLKTQAFVLRRTNLGEADRLLDLLTPEGRLTVLAKSSRREKSKLAGGIELFCLSDIQIHHSVKTDRNILSSAKMKVFYRHLLENLATLELASAVLKDIERASRDADDPAYFSILKQFFTYLDGGQPSSTASSTSPTSSPAPNLALARLWFYLNLKSISGEDLNLLFDADGDKLQIDEAYAWDPYEAVFRKNGPLTANHIKLLRLCLASPLSLAAKVKNLDTLLPDLDVVLKTWYN